ncbi:TPR repeat protein [Pseudomonas nitritireducens]|uniref:TPR repeat protein n=1 Tax=Pseudomonas nitroreducens TaxID=46680 RepID=A0A7W7KIM9_PSENT|nr:tetratricopeptide repeat protein [Pseudomonas nitritireducens]MBB4863459.1 TPR repeat protein [Pseudomonas nitritireducens]
MSFVLRRTEEINVEDLTGQLADDPRQTARLILAGAREGDLEAQALLGQILLDGHGIEQDVPLAVTWFSLAADRGHAMARNMLGRCLEHGWGCARDEAAAARQYELAARQKLDWAMYNLANLLSTGRGVARDDARALELYQSAAALGHAKSMNLVGRFHEEGLVAPQNLESAHQWYRRSAEAGDFRGQFSHASVLAERGDLPAARIWLERALQGGNLNFLRVARQQLAASMPPSLSELTLAYFQKAAELGDDSDLHQLAEHLGAV